MNYSKIIFERLTLAHFPILIYYLRKQKEISFFDNEGSAKKKNWVKRLVKKGRLLELPPLRGANYNECYGTALDNVDKVYEYLTSGSALVREMAKIYGDENIELAYKKGIAKALSEFYYINSYLEQEERKLRSNERILFIPYTYKKYLRLAKKSGAFYHNHRNIDIAYDSEISNHLRGLFKKVKGWFLQLGITIFHCSRLMISRKRSSQVKEYKYAIPIRNLDFQTKFKTRWVDFLLDGNNIREDNTIFMLLDPSISKDSLDEIKSKNLNMIDCSKRFTPSNGFNNKEIIHVLRRILPYAIKHTFWGLFENDIVLDVNTILLHTFFSWSFILQEISIKHFITFNDEGIDHIGRNILLHKIGAKTWYYAHSSAFSYLTLPANSDIANSRRWLWSFLYYDYYISWNNEIIEYYKLHPQRIKNYISTGCLWSQAIVDILDGRITSNLGKNIFTNFDKDKYKTLSFFDSTYVPNSALPLEDGVIFYECILQLMEEFSDILVIVKEKKSEEAVLDLYCEKFGGDSDIFYRQYKPILDALRKHPRCHVTGYKGDPAEVVAMSDLTVTYAFSSPTVEALCARKKAIFFDPGNRWRGCRYDRIPSLVAHNYEELKYLIQKLLYETTEEEYSDFLDTYAKGVADPYLDGKAVTRFRELLGE